MKGTHNPAQALNKTKPKDARIGPLFNLFSNILIVIKIEIILKVN